MTIHAHIQGTNAADAPSELNLPPKPVLAEPVEALSFSPGGTSADAKKDNPSTSSGQTEGGAEQHFRAALSALETTHTDAAQGWTPQRQSHFLAAIADGATVQDAAKEVGLSRRSAYAFRRRANRQAFNLGWQAAEILARDSLREDLWDRARNSQSWTTVRDDGEKIVTTTRHRHDNRLALAMLTRLDAKMVENEEDEVLAAEKFDELLVLIESGDAPAARLQIFEHLFPVPDGQLDIGTCEPCESPVPEADPPVYDMSMAGGDWWTDFPPSPDFEGEERGRFGEPDYHRELDPCELAMIEHFTGRKAPVADPAAIAAAEAARDAWFEAAASFSCAEDVVVESDPENSPPAGRGDGAGAPTGEGVPSEEPTP